MSVCVQCGEQVLWEPSLKVAQLFWAAAQAIEAAVGKESGIENNLSVDEININKEVFVSFVAASASYLSNTNNGALFVLCAGGLEVMFFLHWSLTEQWPEVPENLRPLILAAQSLMRSDWPRYHGRGTIAATTPTTEAENWTVYGPRRA